MNEERTDGGPAMSEINGMRAKPLVFHWGENPDTSAHFEMNAVAEGIKCRVTQGIGGDQDWSFVVNHGGQCGFATKEDAQARAETAANDLKQWRVSIALATIKQFPEILAALEPAPCPHCDGMAGCRDGWCADMSKAPRDGTMLDLLVKSDCHALEDTSGLYTTIGQNTRDNMGGDFGDVWETVGWSWQHDCFLSVGGPLSEGHADQPVGWRLRPPLPQPAEGVTDE